MSSGTAHRAHRPIGGGGAATLPFSSTRFRLLGRVSRRLSVCFGRGSGWGDNEKRKFGWGGWCRGYRRVDAVGEETERRRATRIARPADGMWGLWPVGARLGPGPLRRCRRRSERRRGPVAVTTSRRGPRRDMWVMPKRVGFELGGVSVHLKLKFKVETRNQNRNRFGWKFSTKIKSADT